jgi:hypothetical protein
MKTNMFKACAALSFGSLLVLAPISNAYAIHGSTWLVGILALTAVDVSVTKDGFVVGRLRTDAKGQVVLKGLAPGDYEIAVDGESLVAATDKLAPPPKRSDNGGPSLSIGGGLFGGSGHSSSDHGGAGPSGHDGGSHSGSGGGVGLGVSVPLGGGGDNNGSGPQDNPITAITITLPSNPDAINTANWGTGTSFASETPYCRDSAIRGAKIHVTIGKGGGSLVMSIFDRWGQL